jgi:hypothetical protein
MRSGAGVPPGLRRRARAPNDSSAGAIRARARQTESVQALPPPPRETQKLNPTGAGGFERELLLARNLSQKGI